MSCSSARCYWGPRKIAHTIISFAFRDQRHLAISIETRKEKGETYSALRGFFRQFELYYVVGDERDVIRLRTNIRGERVYLYRLTMSLEKSRELLIDYVTAINRLVENPRWYNALTTNCTTTIRYHTKNIARISAWHWRMVLNGYVDELGYDRGGVDTSMPFAELRALSDITEVARAAGADPEFSSRIRQGLPDPRARQTTAR